MPTQPEFIESTAGKVAEELARRGIPPAQRVTITIEPDEPNDWIAKARALLQRLRHLFSITCAPCSPPPNW